LLALGINVSGQFPIALRSTDGTNSFTQSSSIIVTAVAPTASFGNNGPVGQFSTTSTVSLTNVTHPSPPVVAAGYRYSFDFDNNGTFEITNSTDATANVPASFLTAPSRIVHGRVMSVANNLFSDYTTTIAVIVPPRVQSVSVNDGSAQRSRVTSLTVTFDSLIVLPNPPQNAFVLTRTGGTVIALTADTSLSTATQTIVRLTFAGTGVTFGSLDDGRYTLSVLANQVHDGIGQELDGNNDGMAGGDFAFLTHRLFGDADGDAHVTGSDFLAFRLAFLSTNAAFDYDNDGSVTGLDFLQFRLRFLSMV
jgi:hypothetical protein